MNQKILLLALSGIALYLTSRKSAASVNYYDTTAPYDFGDVDAIFDYSPPEETMSATAQTSSLTRGERNNNPGNIIKGSSAWKGMAVDQSGDGRFVVFSTPEYGIRALAKILQSYSSRGYNTVNKIIRRYAPSVENNTSAYIASVAGHMAVSPDQTLNLNDRDTLNSLVDAIITHENGRNIYASSGVMNAGVSMVA